MAKTGTDTGAAASGASDAAGLRKAARAPAPAVVRAYPPGASEPLATGELDFVDSAVDTASGTILVKARFQNQDFVLWPGMYIDVEIDLDVFGPGGQRAVRVRLPV